LVKEREMAINFREYRVKNDVVVIPVGGRCGGLEGASRVWAIRRGSKRRVRGGYVWGRYREWI
jgi:CTP synthase (UTP-ammonia lyase)